MKKILIIAKFVFLVIVSCASAISGINTSYASGARNVRVNKIVDAVKVQAQRIKAATNISAPTKMFKFDGGVEIKNTHDPFIPSHQSSKIPKSIADKPNTDSVDVKELRDITPSSGATAKFSEVGANTFVIDNGSDSPIINVPNSSNKWTPSGDGTGGFRVTNEPDLIVDYNTE